MNNPFHRAAVKCFCDTMHEHLLNEDPGRFAPAAVAALSIVFEAKLEDQARAFDACKRGTEISMATLSHEMLKAFYLAKARIRLDGDWAAAERVFNDHMKPHFEIRLW